MSQHITICQHGHQPTDGCLKCNIAELEREASVAHGAVDFWQAAEAGQQHRAERAEHRSAENGKEICRMRTRAEQAEAALVALKTNPGPVSDSQCDRCQLDASVRADKAEAALAERDRMLDELAAAIMEAGAFCWASGTQTHPAREELRVALRGVLDLRARAEEGSGECHSCGLVNEATCAGIDGVQDASGKCTHWRAEEGSET